MERNNVYGKLVPIDDQIVSDEYMGHFLKISYSEIIGGHAVFSEDRIDVEADGNLYFTIPLKSLLQDEVVYIEVYAPDGELLKRDQYQHVQLASENPTDVTVFEIKVNPKLPSEVTDESIELLHKKISGKVIDLSGEKTLLGLQVTIMVTQDVDHVFNVQEYEALFSTVTDESGYFYGQVVNKTVQQAFAVISGMESEPIPIHLEQGKLPKKVMVVADLTQLDENAIQYAPLPNLPDSEDLVNSNAFSQDIGGKCVDFTIPNRTLEEFSYFHTVRTTQPEIRGVTITLQESQEIRNEISAMSVLVFPLFTRLNSSLQSLSSVSMAFKEKESTSAAPTSPRTTKASMINTTFSATSLVKNVDVIIDNGSKNGLSLSVHDLMLEDKSFLNEGLIKFILEQGIRKQKLKEMQQRLAAAYCGVDGATPPKSYCESLQSEIALNREELRALIGHLDKNLESIILPSTLDTQFMEMLFNLKKFMENIHLNDKLIHRRIVDIENLIVALDTESDQISGNANILKGYLQRIVVELSHSQNSAMLSFEPCPSIEVQKTKGIICLMNEFSTIKVILDNKSILTLGEISSIKDYLDVFEKSITAFSALLDEFKDYYDKSASFSISLSDDYFIKEYDGTSNRLSRLVRDIVAIKIKVNRLENAYIQNHPGRVRLSVETSVDWDETPTIYENTTIAHGHILHYKQKWKADGYSLGDLLYSLPLAPCQEKQIVVLDWDRVEQGQRDEIQSDKESLAASSSRDRDIQAIQNALLEEDKQASSSSRTRSTSAAAGGGIGGFIGGAIFGVAGGVSHSGASTHSTASQSSAKKLAASSFDRLRERTSQASSYLRSQRSTVIQTVRENESVSVQSEVVKNNNHCHAMTVEYFEVLKHYAIEEELADVQEVLFLPLPMGHFNYKKILRWKNTLRKVMYGRKLQQGFDAIERIDSNYAHSDFPLGSYADELIKNFTGHFTISFELKRPYIPAIEDETKTIYYDLSIDFPWFGEMWVIPVSKEVPLSEAEKDRIFEEKYAPEIVRSFIDKLQIDTLSDTRESTLDLDLTLISNYRKGQALKVNIASKSNMPIRRRDIEYLRIRANTLVKSSSKIILRSMYLHYQTAHMRGVIIQNSHVNNDIINTVEMEYNYFPVIKTDAALLYTPLNHRELVNPRKEDTEAALALKDYLNEHLELSHKAIWANMDGSRLFGLIDRYIAPNSGGRSVASVVENRILGIVGNNLVLKVVPGERLDPLFRKVSNLFEYYQTATKPDPYRISVPTKGVYAESVMGRCNSCETIDDTRHWRFDKNSCATSATSINPISTDSRHQSSPDLQTKDMPTNVLSVQSTPIAPDPLGLASAYGLLGKGDTFSDITGLSGTQANTLSALQTTSKSVTDMASISKDFANLAVLSTAKRDGAKQIEQIKKLQKDGYLDETEGKKQIKKVLNTYSDAAKSVTKPKKKQSKSVANKLADKVIKDGLNKKGKEVEYQNVTPEGEKEQIIIREPLENQFTGDDFSYRVSGIVPVVEQPTSMSCWAAAATMLISWHDHASYDIATAMEDVGARFKTLFDDNSGISNSELSEFITAAGLRSAPAMSYPVSEFKRLLEDYGPLMVVGDEDPSQRKILHARVVYGIYGDGTATGTHLRINDPANGGRQYSESFRTFVSKYEDAADTVNEQIIHF